MKNQEFKSFLLRSAVFAMACDGAIDEREIETIKGFANNEIFFLGLEYETPLKEYINEVKLTGKLSINNYLSELGSLQLNSHQELQLIAVILAVINADNKAEENELKFLHLVKGKLKTDQEMLFVQFPTHIHQLMDLKNYSLNKDFSDEIIFKD